ncbi:efflux RND transporter periplasmic adaptor subunit [Heliobacterium gestii]|uniref:Efflux RND transporter periplasmic adaptor subunit n=1 Tax=Heliomicrobium gestii TaxID=2699 RepID=A0A845LKZ6_HELGE|nr:efflux RND transporter periplasmic adaptor subunit [Heliomicrobium gestii]MZP44063.1 efflux RND transporter periplasmic adaptor subunit [Heliomicrobium gestii]
MLQSLKTRWQGIGKTRKRLIAGILVVAVAGGGWAALRPAQKLSGVPVSAREVSAGDLEVSVVVSGKIEPYAKENITARVKGKLVKVFVEAGQTVKAGDVLALIDKEDMSRKESDARVNLQVEQLNLDKSRQAALYERDKARETAEQSRKKMELNKRNLDRTQALFDSGAAAKKDLDEAVHTYEDSASQYRNDQLHLESIETNDLGTDIKLKEAQIQLKRQDWETAARDLDECAVKAPMDGMVLEVPVDPGDYIAPETKIAVLGRTDRLKIKADVSEADLPQIGIGMAAQVTGPALGDKQLNGNVTVIAPQAVTKEKEQTEKTTVPVTVEVDNPEGVGRPGTNVDLRIKAAHLTQVLTAPHEAIRESRNGKEALVVRDGKVVICPVVTGKANDIMVEVKSGIQAGDQLILNPPEDLLEGTPVTILPPNVRPPGQGVKG